MAQNRRSLQVIYPNAAGLDIGAKEIFAALPAEVSPPSVRCFGTFTPDLIALRDWLLSHGITTVAMESTGVYWIPIYDVLSAAGVEVALVNPREVKQVPGRKTDVADCQWIQELHSLGLLRGAFRPSEGACEVRELVRQRQRLIQDKARQVQHMQKALLQMNVQLSQVVSDLSGDTGMRIIGAILQGERRPEVLATLRDPRCKQDETTIAKALLGTWRKEHLLSLKQAHALHQTYQELLTEVEREIVESVKARFPDRPVEPPHEETAPPKGGGAKSKKGDFSTPIREVWEEKTGLDLTEIEGISAATASLILAEVGMDIHRFKSAKHLASWAGLSPRQEISGGKVVRQAHRRTNRVGRALCLSSWTLKKSKGPLGSYYRSMVLKKGSPKAIQITAHKLLRIIYAMLTQGAAYAKALLEEMTLRQGQRKMAYLKRQAKNLGLQLVPVGGVS